MLKRLSHILIVILITSGTRSFGSAPAMLGWQKCFGGSAQDIPGSISKSNDGNIFILGNVESHNGDITSYMASTDIWLTKTDTAGNIIWRKTFGGSSIDVGISVIELANGNIYIGGYSSSVDGNISNSKGNFDVILLCLDATGNLLWEKNFGGSQVDLCYSMIVTNDGNFALGGATFSDDGDVTFNEGGQDIWLLKIDVNGNLLWELNSGGSGTDICYALTQDAAGNIYGTGTTNSNDGDITFLHGNYDVCVFKAASNGSLIWNKTFGGSEYESAQTILIDNQQKLFVGGYTRSDNGDITSNEGFGDVWFLQVSNQGSLLFQKTYGGTGSENLYSLIQTIDGGYLLAAGTTSNDFDIKNTCGYEDVWLLKLNSQLNTEWSRNYGGTGSDRPVKMINNTNGGYLIAAYTFSNDIDVTGQHGSADIWIIGFSCVIPSASFSTSTAVCLGDTLIIQNTSSNSMSYSWSVNNVVFSNKQSVAIPLLVTGNYHIELAASTCATVSTSSTDITVINCTLPVVNIQASTNNTCVNSQVYYNDNSNATSWQWTFPGGNPSTSTLRNPVVTYSQPGVYSVMLTATNIYGNQSSMRLNFMTVNSLPATPVITMVGNQLTSSFASNYQWLYNNNPIANANLRQFNATTDGNYSVMVSNAYGCTSTSQTVYYSLTGINEESSGIFVAYPNPTTGPLNIIIPSNSFGTISIYDMNGSILQEKRIESGSGLKTSLANYAPGMYRIVFTDNNYKTTQLSIINY